jgi:hypothetical protein
MHAGRTDVTPDMTTPIGDFRYLRSSA